MTRNLLTLSLPATTASQRSHNSGCAALFPTVGRCRQQRAHFAWVVFEINAPVPCPDSIFRSLRIKNSSSSSFGIEAIAFSVAVQDDRGFQRVADQFLLPRVLDRLADHAPQIQQLRDLVLQRGIFRHVVSPSGNY